MLEKEENLIQQAISGSRESFGKLYDLHHHKIYRFIFLKIGHREECEDLTHQVFLSAWENIQSFEVRQSPFSSWLYRIAKNKVIDHYRLRKPVVSLDLLEDTIATESLTSELAAERSLELEKIRTAMLSLSEEQQDVLIMRFVEDLPLKDVAAALNKNVGAVKLIQYRAINKLKVILDEDETNHSTA